MLSESHILPDNGVINDTSNETERTMTDQKQDKRRNRLKAITGVLLFLLALVIFVTSFVARYQV